METTGSHPTADGVAPSRATSGDRPACTDDDGGGAASPPLRWWLAVLVSLAASLPLIWLLSFAGLLPFLLGLFFFMLFGVVIGAVAHRVAAPCRPYGRVTLLVGTTVIVVLVWGAALVKESYDFPRDMAKNALTRRQEIGERTAGEYKTLVAGQVRSFLAKRYPSGGPVGYVRWMIDGGKIEKGKLPNVDRALSRGQAGGWHVLRLLLSLAFLGYGVASQTFPMRLATESSTRPTEERE